MDDMRTNIPMLAKAKTESKVAAMAVNCLQESLSNINEYLCSQADKLYGSTAVVATHLSAFQYLNGLMSYVLGAGVRAFIIRNNNIKELSNAYSHLSGALGESTMIESHVETTTLIAGDILFIASSDDISIIEEDFIRITLSRFPDSLETALRQINTRVARKATSQAPGIILCRVMQNTVLKRSWVGKFKKP
ncbi:MAG: hypothetical protein GY770_26630 [Aestuariibacter sp.]|nr:hypothetical protein [Aestuariibacter sp.]